MSDIPPPLRPDNTAGQQPSLLIPFLLAEAPRLQLELLSRHKSLPQAHRDAIKEWLRGYNERVVKWLHDNYGPEAVKAADALSRASARHMNEKQREAQAQAEKELFNHLAKEMEDDD